jgi:hypothetical protein
LSGRRFLPGADGIAPGLGFFGGVFKLLRDFDGFGLKPAGGLFFYALEIFLLFALAQ